MLSNTKNWLIIAITFYALIVSSAGIDRVKHHKSQHKLGRIKNLQLAKQPEGKHSISSNTKDDDDDDDDDDYDDGMEDDENAVEATAMPSNFYHDIYLNSEDGFVEPSQGANPLVDFIVVKHRFSNATGLSFPAYISARKHKKHTKLNQLHKFSEGKIKRKTHY